MEWRVVTSQSRASLRNEKGLEVVPEPFQCRAAQRR